MLSEIQKRVFQHKKNGLSYTNIVASEPELTCNRQISCCLRRTALRLPWEPGTTSGADPYLAEEDEELLCYFIEENAADFTCLTTWEVQDSAHAIKTWRYDCAVQELLSIGCPHIAAFIPRCPNQPSRSWINDFCLRRGLRLAKRREIEAARLQAGYFDDLSRFLLFLNSEIGDTPPELIFNADETMLSGKRQYKGVIGEDVQVAIGSEHQDRQHMTAMATVCAGGAKVPLFLILTALQQLPESLSFTTSKCWVASSANGWMTKYLFLDYVINFCHWLTFYRLQLPRDLRAKTAILVLDGHATRLNPAALEYLKRFNVKVVTLPSHSTHILQPFDVGVAGAFKAQFKKSMVRLAAETEAGRDALRAATVTAALDAYDSTATVSGSKAAFARAGIVPCSPQRLLQNPYVRPGSSPNPTVSRGFPLNGKTLTNDIPAIFAFLQGKRDKTDSTMMTINPSIQHQLSRNRSVQDGRLLSSYHPVLIQFQVTEFQ